jgi:hypothetical protein
LEVHAATQAGANAAQAATHAGTWSTMVAAQRRTRRRHVPRPCLRRNDPLLTTCPKATRRYLSPMMSTRSTTTLPPTPRRRAKSKPSKKRAVKKTRPEPRGALEEDTARCSPRVLRLASTDQFPASVSRKQGAKFRTPDRPYRAAADGARFLWSRGRPSVVTSGPQLTKENRNV